MDESTSKRLSVNARCLCVVCGIVLPALYYIILWPGRRPIPAWQSGRPMDYAILMLNRESFMYFLPFAGYAGVSMALATFSPRFFAGGFPVRLGLVTGIVLSAQYAIVGGVILGQIAVEDMGLWGAVGIVALVGLLMIWIIWRRVPTVARITVVLLAVLLGCQGSAFGLFMLLLVPLSGPFLTFLAYVAALREARRFEPEPTTPAFKLGLSATWTGFYALAWWFGVAGAAEVYRSLPDYYPFWLE